MTKNNLCDSCHKEEAYISFTNTKFIVCFNCYDKNKNKIEEFSSNLKKL